MTKIEALRRLLELDGESGDTGTEKFNEIDDLLYEAASVEVKRNFSEGSRWSNYQTVIHKVTTLEEGDVFFALEQEVPATEMQDGGDFSFEFDRVFPRERTVIVYE